MAKLDILQVLQLILMGLERGNIEAAKNLLIDVITKLTEEAAAVEETT